MSVSTEKKSILDTIREHLEIISEKAGLDAKLVIIGLVVACVFVFIGYFDQYITTFVGIAYPAFWSIRAIESKETDDDKQWLTYWVVFSLFSIIDLFSAFVLKFIPFYFFLKMIFLIWLFMPNFKGATFVYDHFLIKIFKKYETEIEKVGTKIIGKAGEFVQDGKTYVRDNQGNIVSGVLSGTAKVAELTKDK